MRLFRALIPAIWLFMLVPEVWAASSKNSEKDQPERIDPLIPVGHGGKGLKIPVFDTSGKLRMSLQIEIATRTDDDHLAMDVARLETFDDEGKPEMVIETKASVLDLESRIVSSNEPVLIRRSDFELTGDHMEFNARTREGKLKGNIRMLIYDRNTATEKTEHDGPAAKPSP